jgi:transposase
MSQLTEKERYEIIIKHEMGINNVQIAKSLNISRITVAKWIKKYINDNNVNRTKGSGRKKI